MDATHNPGPNTKKRDDLEPLPPLKPRPGRCNARMSRRRGYCGISTFQMANGRCRYHGGPTPKLVASVAKSSKSEYLPPSVYARFETLNGTVLDNLEESIKIQQALETSIIERLGTGESHLAWSRILDILSSLSLIEDIEDEEDELSRLEGRLDRIEAAITELRQVVTNGSRSFAVQAELRKELAAAHESQRKLTETLTKCRKEMQETYTEEEWNIMLLAILACLKRNAPHQVLTTVVKEFQDFNTKQLLTGTKG